MLLNTVCHCVYLGERVDVALWDLHLKQNLRVYGHGCLEYLVYTIFLVLQKPSRSF